MDDHPSGSDWQPSNQPHYDPPTSHVYTSSSQNYVDPQGTIQSFAPMVDNHFPNINNFSQAQSSFDRMASPIDQFHHNEVTSDTLQQALSQDGNQLLRVMNRNQISFQVPLLLSGEQSTFGQDQNAVTIASVSDHFGMVQNSTISTAPTLQNPCSSSSQNHIDLLTQRDQSISQLLDREHVLSQLADGSHEPVAGPSREHQVSQLIQSSENREHSVSQSDSQAVLHVVSGMPQFPQAEPSSSEATPLVIHRDQEDDNQMTSEVNINSQSKNEEDSYPSEPDTTQDDLQPPPPTFQPIHHLSEAARHQSDLPSSSLGNTVDDVMNTPSTPSIDSTVHHNVFVVQPSTSDITMVSHIDTSGITMETNSDDDREIQDMLSNQPGSSNHFIDSSVLQGEPQQQHEPMEEASNSHENNNLENLEAVQGQSNILKSCKVRKSNRLASIDGHSSSDPKPKYDDKAPYNPNHLWCEDCQDSYESGCPRHKQIQIYDKVVLSRAWASLPPQLQIFRLGETTELGLFAKKHISRRTQFGPFIGEIVDSKDKLTSDKFLLQVEKQDSHCEYLEATDENKCNWMMFVRVAENFSEQNLVAYQYGPDIYFSTIKPIEPKVELKVWYAPHYAHRLGVATFESEEQEDEEDKWPCYECNKKFKSSALLQKHLSVHEESIDQENFDQSGDAKKGRKNRKVRNSFANRKFDDKQDDELKNGLDENGEIEDEDKTEQGSESSAVVTSGGNSNQPSFQSWKKKKTNIYFKLKNKYRPDAMKHHLKPLYRKSQQSDWMCMHCDLTFDSPSLLNLHTLTHAAEDIGLEEIKKEAATAAGVAIADVALALHTSDKNDVATVETSYTCPVCQNVFSSKNDLIQHASKHGKSKFHQSIKQHRPFKCNRCPKAFSIKERLQAHMLCHGEESLKPLQCTICKRRFMNNSALSCHMKTHSDKSYYDCPICQEGFDQIMVLKSHVQEHMVNGVFTCPECHKDFTDYHMIRKHMRAFHGPKKFPCPECTKIFPRQDKLKLHMLRHSSHREFMCDTCGRQFKRKDKLKEHIKRMHSGDKDEKINSELFSPTKSVKKFTPKVLPTDYQRFIYKCNSCMLGFKRRGMLVNHLAKRHPDIKPDMVPELNLPILKTQRDYFCQYCEKVYKSNSKRKAHILKNHPGAILPASARKVVDHSQLGPNPTYSQTVGSVPTVPHPCNLCHKQYASKAKLLQHQRKKHWNSVAALEEVIKSTTKSPKKTQQNIIKESLTQADQSQGTILTTVQDAERLMEGNIVEVSVNNGETIHSDLLTQAMSELTQNLDFRTAGATEIHLTSNLGQAGTQQLVQNQGTSQTATIDLSQLTSQLVQFQTQPAQVANQIIQQPQGSAAGTMPQQFVTLATQQGQQAQVAIPVSLANAAFVPRTWATTTNFQNFR